MIVKIVEYSVEAGIYDAKTILKLTMTKTESLYFTIQLRRRLEKKLRKILKYFSFYPQFC